MMRSKYALINSMMSITIFIISGILQLITRKVMLPVLGSEIVGLTATFTDILSFLNLADMGISGSVSACLYGPINNKNYPKVHGILLFLKNAYLVCGMMFTSVAVIISGIMLLVFKSGTITGAEAAVYFLLTALSTALSFFFSYRLVILSTDQRMFSLKLVNSGVMIVSTVCKVLVLIHFHSFILFLLIDIVFNFLYYTLMNALIRKKYSKVEKAKPSFNADDRHDIVRKIKGLAFHRIGGFALYGTNSFYTAVFSGLTSAAILSNYQMIITFLNGIIISFTNGITASIGNLIATTEPKKQYQTYRMLFMVSAIFTAAASVTFFNSVQVFMSAYYGSQYLANQTMVALLTVNFFIIGIRPITEQFKNVAGIFYEDRYVPLVEAVFNTLCCVILGYKFGLTGVVAGNVISTLAIVFWQKPYMTFKYVFHRKLRWYFYDLLQYVLVGLTCLLLSSALCGLVGSRAGWLAFIGRVVISLTVCLLIPLVVFSRTKRFKNCLEYFRTFYEHVFRKRANAG